MTKRRADLLDELRALRLRALEIEGELGGATDEAPAPIDRVRRALSVLASVQEAIDGAADEATLFARACDVVVQSGAYKKAWVGVAEHDERRTVTPVAVTGVPPALHHRPDVVWSDTERGRGPMGVAIRTGKVALVRDTLADPSFLPWRAAAVEAGIGAAVAFPLIADGRAFGGLIVLASEPDAFDAEEIVLLGEVARSLARARTALRAEAHRRVAETRLDEVLTRCGVVAFAAPAGGERVEFMSGAVEPLLGHPAEALRTTPGLWREIVSEDDLPALWAAMEELGRTGRVDAELGVRAPAAERRWVRVSMQVVCDAAGAPERVEGIIVDIADKRRADEELLASQRYLKSVLDSLPINTALLDGEAHILAVNAPWIRFAVDNGSFDRTGGLGQSYLHVCDAAAGDPWSAAAGRGLRDVLAGRLPSFEIEYPCHTPASERWFSMRVAPVPPGEGPGRVVVSHLEITSRKLAEEALRQSEARFRHVVDAGFDAVTFTDAAGFVEYASAAWERVLGHPPRSLLRQNAFSVVHPDDRPRVQEQLLALGAEPGASADLELRVRHADGHYLWIGMSVLNLLHEPAVRAVVSNARDITDQKRAELSLQRMNAELEQRVAERTGELRRANEALERASRIKDEFLAGMSHELRTPLNAVLGLSEAMAEEVYGPITDRQRATVRRIEESGRHLLSLINDILDLSKIEAGKSTLELGPVDIDDLCRASMRLVQEAARKKHLRISHKLRGSFGAIVADERRLKQVLLNLLSNAVKFTPDGGQIGLDATLDEDEATLELCVWDTGIGMSPAEMDRLFQPFVQLDSGLSRRHAGTGLGLALVRRLVDQHGGGVTVQSTPGSGSRFTVLVPARRPSLPSLPAPSGRRISRALIIDDSSNDAEHLERYLAESGVEAILHPTAAGAVERAAAEQPEVIFLDILLPEEIGWDVLHALKTDRRTARLPVVVTSVLDRPIRGVAAEADDYILKPATRARLAEALTRIATSSSARGKRSSPPGVRRILLADDAATNVETLLDFLASRGFEVLVARDGHEAVAIARAKRPDLILMDIQMPHLDGLAATRLLREDPNPEVRAIPIIALTALAMTGDRERCLAAGADDYLTKPVGLRALASAIEARFIKQ